MAGSLQPSTIHRSQEPVAAVTTVARPPVKTWAISRPPPSAMSVTRPAGGYPRHLTTQLQRVTAAAATTASVPPAKNRATLIPHYSVTAATPPTAGRPISMTTRGSVIRAITGAISPAPSAINQIAKRSPGKIPPTPLIVPAVTPTIMRVMNTRNIRAEITTSVNYGTAAAAVTNIPIVHSPQFGKVETQSTGSMMADGSNVP